MRTNPITIKQIFKDHWPDYLTKNPNTPDYVIKQVEKMLACRNPQKLGYHVYQCQDHPWECKFIPNTCKSRFCNSCGKKPPTNSSQNSKPSSQPHPSTISPSLSQTP